MKKEKKILQGKKMIVFLNKPKDKKLNRLLNYWGAEAECFSIIHTDALNDYSKLKSKLNNLAKYKYLIFTSAIAIDYFLARVLGEFENLDCLKGKQIITLGANIAKRLLDYGINIDFIAHDYKMETVLKKLIQISQPADRALWISGRMTGNFLLGSSIEKRIRNKLANSALHIDTVEVFKISFSDVREDYFKRLPEKIDLIILTDFFALSFLDYLKLKGYRGYEHAKIAVIGPVMQKLVEQAGFEATIIPSKAGIEELVEAIIDYYLTADRGKMS